MKESDLIKALAVTAELCGATFSEAAARVFVDDLKGLDPRALVAAFQRCRREVRGRLTVKDVLDRLDDGRPGPEEAWGMVPKDGPLDGAYIADGDGGKRWHSALSPTVVWTDEMRVAWGAAYPLIAGGDMVAARMAFKESYDRLVQQARSDKQAPRWSVSYGADPASRTAPVLEAVARGRITRSQAAQFLPGVDLDTGLPFLPAPGARLALPAKISSLTAALKVRGSTPDLPPEPSKKSGTRSAPTREPRAQRGASE